MKRFLILWLVVVSAWAVGRGADVVKTTLDYAVTGSDTLRLDRYAAVRCTEAPTRCMIFVFGGGFAGGERDNSEYLPFFNEMARSGYEVVSIDYRLGLRSVEAADLASPDRFAGRLGGAVSMAVEDLFTATSFVLDHATDWNIDPRGIIVCGSSAGAITVLQAEYVLCSGQPRPSSLPADFGYAGVISFAGAIFGLTPELQWGEAPAPMLLFHGTNDSNVPYGVLRLGNVGFFGSESVAASLRAIGSPYLFYSVAGADHSLATSPMRDDVPVVKAFISQFVADGARIMEQADVTVIGSDTTRRQFTLMDYIKSNFPSR